MHYQERLIDLFDCQFKFQPYVVHDDGLDQSS